MLSIERIKELMEKPDMSDKKASEIRDGLYDLAKIIFDKWRMDKKAFINKSNTNNNIPAVKDKNDS
jgi:hypothetical protein